MTTSPGLRSGALPSSSTPRPRIRRSLVDLGGIAWVLIAAAAVMTPALAHGASLGPITSLARYGLTHKHIVGHPPKATDQITLFIPWTTLAWAQVHQGHLPLWNPYSVLGMPLAFNWESAPFGLPALIGYLFPLRLAYTAGVMATLVIAGTGVYVLGRVIGLGVFGCVMAATVYELSGRFMVTLGWSLGSVMSWAGWLFAIAILVVRGRHRVRDIALLALVLAAMVYAGYPEGVILLGIGIVVFLVVFLLARLPRFGGSGPIGRPVVDLSVAAIAGAALSAPLILPGLQVIAGSSRNARLGVGVQTIASRELLNAIVPAFDGLSWGGHFGPSSVGSSVFYVGVITAVMALVGLAMRWRHAVVLGFAIVGVVTFGLVFVPPLASLIDRFPDAGTVRFYDALGPLTLAIAVLAGVGTDVITALVSPASRSVLDSCRLCWSRHIPSGPLVIWSRVIFDHTTPRYGRTAYCGRPLRLQSVSSQWAR